MCMSRIIQRVDVYKFSIIISAVHICNNHIHVRFNQHDSKYITMIGNIYVLIFAEVTLLNV